MGCIAFFGLKLDMGIGAPLVRILVELVFVVDEVGLWLSCLNSLFGDWSFFVDPYAFFKSCSLVGAYYSMPCSRPSYIG